jgi:hypothetical protein
VSNRHSETGTPNAIAVTMTDTIHAAQIRVALQRPLLPQQLVHCMLLGSVQVEPRADVTAWSDQQMATRATEKASGISAADVFSAMPRMGYRSRQNTKRRGKRVLHTVQQELFDGSQLRLVRRRRDQSGAFRALE